MAMFSDRVDRIQVAQHWIRKHGYMLDRALDFYGKNKDRLQFLHVDYRDLVRDPLPVLQRIYAARNEQIDEGLRETFVSANEGNRQGKYGQHVYSLADFDMDESYVDQYTSHYQEFRKQL